MNEYYAMVKLEAEEPQDGQALADGIFEALMELQEDGVTVTDVTVLPSDVSEQCQKLLDVIPPISWQCSVYGDLSMKAICIICGELNYVCCDNGFEETAAGIVHNNPMCIDCCTQSHPVIWDGKSVAGGTYEVNII